VSDLLHSNTIPTPPSPAPPHPAPHPQPPPQVPFEDRSLLRKALEFHTHIPSTPELCGVQAIVPKQVHSYLTESVHDVVLQKSIPTKIRQVILDIGNSTEGGCFQRARYPCIGTNQDLSLQVSYKIRSLSLVPP